MFGLLDIDNSKSLPSASYIGIGPCQIHALGVLQWHDTRSEYWVLLVSHINRFEPVVVGNKQIPELQCRGARILQRHNTLDMRVQRVIEIENDDARVSHDIDKMTADGDMAGATQNSAFVP